MYSKENQTFWNKPERVKTPKIYRLAKVGKKKRERMKQGTETSVFEQIWNERPHFCEICGDPIQEPCSWCFAHKLPKGLFPAFRLIMENIGLVCSIDCHHEQDKGFTLEKRRSFELYLKEKYCIL